MKLRRLMLVLNLLAVMIFMSCCGPVKKPEAEGEVTATAEPAPLPTDIDIPVPDVSSLSVNSELEKTGTLRVAVFYSEEFNRAVEIFNETYPGWQVETVPLYEEVEVVGDDGNTYTRYDDAYVDSMSLIERNEVDIVNTLWYNTGQFLKSDKMEDLAVMFQDDVDFNLNRLLPGVRGLLMTVEGKLPLMPVSFNAKALFPNDGITIHQSDEIPKEWTWYEMLDWFEDDFKDNGVETMLYESAFNFMENRVLLENMNYLYNESTERANVNSPVLENIIRLTRHLLDTGRLNGIHWDTMGSSPDYMPWDTGYTDYLLTYFYLGENVVDYTTLMTTYGQAYPYPYIEGTKGKSVQLSNNYGINAGSSASVKRAAWELLKILISDEIQNSGLLNASSVVSELTREGVARNIYGWNYTQATEARAKEMADSITQEALDKYNNDRLDYFADISQLYYRTAEGVEGVMFDKSIPYFRDSVSIEDTIESIAQGIADNKAWQEYQAMSEDAGGAGGNTGSSVADRKLLERLESKMGD